MITHNIEVFLGDPIEDRDERHVLNRLRGDLARRGILVRIFANFVTGVRRQRQVDLLVVTATRLVHVELKNLDPDLPVLGRANGPWQQLLPDGRHRLLDHNFYRQAHETTYALSDQMRLFARRGMVPSAARQFYDHIDTVICLHPGVPAGSRLEGYRHVDVVGYTQLLDRLATSGPRPPWTDDDWDTYARELGVYLQTEQTPFEQSRRASVDLVVDYRRRYHAEHSVDLHELIPIGFAEDPAADPLETVVSAASARRIVTVTGDSGTGKSHLARHAALTLAAQGGVPVWIAAQEYRRAQFGVALARAVAPFTVHSWQALLEAAADSGTPLLLVLDGLNECPLSDRVDLLQQLAAVRLRYPAGVVVTSTGRPQLPSAQDLAQVTLPRPDHQQRQALLASYGVADLDGADVFTTPFELMLAAVCAAGLPAAATPGVLYDAYLSRRCASEATRAGLRLLAAEMDQQVRPSLTIGQAQGLLRRHDPSVAGAAVIDAALTCPLLVVRQGRVRFTHELFARFLAAEQLSVAAPDTASLAQQLRDSRHHDLAEWIVILEVDEDRRLELLLILADADLLLIAMRGQFGPAMAVRVQEAARRLLKETCAVTSSAAFDSRQQEGHDVGHWQVPTHRSARDQALLSAVGLGLRHGLLLPEVAALAEATDRRCSQEMLELVRNGHRSAISTVVEATYGSTWPNLTTAGLPISIVVRACQRAFFAGRRPPGDGPGATTFLEVAPADPRWGLLYLALLLLHHERASDMTLLPDLLRAAWEAGGHRLRMLALERVTDHAGVVDDTTRHRIRQLLNGLDADGNILLSTSLVDALAGYDELEPAETLDSLRTRIAAILAQPRHPLAAASARQIIGGQFENESVVGPCYQAVRELDDERMLRLCTIAANGDNTMRIHAEWLMRQITDRLEHADDAARALVRAAATRIDPGEMMVQEAVQAHLVAMHGWGRIADALPLPEPSDGGIGARAWRLVDELLFGLLRDQPLPAAAVDGIWTELLDLCAPAAVDVLYHLRTAAILDCLSGDHPYFRLALAYPRQVLRLLEWGLANRHTLMTTVRSGHPDWREEIIVSELGRLGTRHTADFLRAHLDDPTIGSQVVTAIRVIEQRHS